MATLRNNTSSPTNMESNGTGDGHAAEPRSEKPQQPADAGHPKHKRLHPVKATKILWKSSSKLSGMVNLLAPAIPIAIALHFVNRNSHRDWNMAVFAVNYIAMIPAANWLAFSAGEVALKMPKTYGATFEVLSGAIVELIFCLVLMFGKQYAVVQAALLGSMLANLLLVTGSCFIAGGIRFQHNELSEFVTEVSGAALLVSAVGLIIPSQFFNSIAAEAGAATAHKTLQVSRIVSIGLLISYFALLFFQLKTHHTTYDAILHQAEAKDEDHHKDQRRRKLSLVEALVILVIALTCVTMHAIFLIEQIPYVVHHGHISDPFMGLILVPLVEKAAEHLTAIDEAWDNAMDLALSHALGGTIQTALLVAPIVVIVSWISGHQMDLRFEYFMAFSLLLAVLVVGSFVRDGKTNWLEGLLLLLIYFIIAVAAWYYPNPPENGEGDQTGSYGASEAAAAGAEGSGGGGEHGSSTTAAAVEAATHVARMLFT